VWLRISRLGLDQACPSNKPQQPSSSVRIDYCRAGTPCRNLLSLVPIVVTRHTRSFVAVPRRTIEAHDARRLAPSGSDKCVHGHSHSRGSGCRREGHCHQDTATPSLCEANSAPRRGPCTLARILHFNAVRAASW